MTRLRWLGLALVAVVLALALRLLRATWRVRQVDAPGPGRRLLCFWHGDQVALTATTARPVVLVSRSRDGELGALAARMLGFSVVRGSSSRGAVGGALGLARSLRGGGEAALAVDGPRGPRHEAAAPAARLASLGSAELVPVGVAVSRGWRLSSWDRMNIPGPFAVVCVVWGEPVIGHTLQEGMDHARGRAAGLLGPAAAPGAEVAR